MKLLSETIVFEEAKSRYEFEGSKRYDSEKLDAFMDGGEFAEQLLFPVMIEFAEYVSSTVMHRRWTGSDITTEQLLEQFIESK
jgi:hypothetical protein